MLCTAADAHEVSLPLVVKKKNFHQDHQTSTAYGMNMQGKGSINKCIK